jgi:hypothetical protein
VAREFSPQEFDLGKRRTAGITNKFINQIYIMTVATRAGHDDINLTWSYAAWLDSQSKAARDSANREDTRYRKTGTQGD